MPSIYCQAPGWVAGIAGQAVTGCAIVLGGKLAMPYPLFGLQADQPCARAVAICGWWAVGLLVTGLSGRRIASIAIAAGQARVALRLPQDHAATPPTEPVRAALAASPEPAQDLARPSGHQVLMIGNALSLHREVGAFVVNVQAA